MSLEYEIRNSFWRNMKRFKKKIMVTFLGLQVLLVGPVIADSVAGIGSEEISQDQTALVD